MIKKLTSFNRIKFRELVLILSLFAFNAAWATVNVQPNGDHVMEKKLVVESILAKKIESASIQVTDTVILNNASISLADINARSVQDGMSPIVIKEELVFAALPSGASSVPGLNSIDNSAIQDDAINQDKIADSAVTSSKIKDTSITKEKFVDQSVTGSKFENGAISFTKIASAGDISSTKLDGFSSKAGTVSASDTILSAIGKLDGSALANTQAIAAIADAANPVLSGETNITGDVNVNGNLNVIGVITAGSIDGGNGSAQLANNLRSANFGANSVAYQSANNTTATVTSSSFAPEKVLGTELNNGNPVWEYLALFRVNVNTSAPGQSCNAACSANTGGACLGASRLGVSVSCTRTQITNSTHACRCLGTSTVEAAPVL